MDSNNTTITTVTNTASSFGYVQSSGYSISSNPSATVDYNLEETVLQKIQNLERSLKEAKESLENIKKLKFKSGDVVIHKQYGNCIIKMPIVKYTENYPPPTSPNYHGDQPFYWILTVNGEKTVPESSLVPYTSVSKKLYEK
jgi:ABC-type phosphate transport system substrate-binding protein